MSPSLIGRCGGGGLNVFFLVGNYNSATVHSGTPKDLVFSDDQTNDTSDVAFHTLGSPTPGVQLVSTAYIYVMTATIYWTSFVGERIFQWSLAPVQPLFALPQQLPTDADVQTLSSVVYPQAGVPATITLTASQSSGSDQIVNGATIAIQATQLNPAP